MELATKTKTAESKIGIHNAATEIIVISPIIARGGPSGAKRHDRQFADERHGTTPSTARGCTI